MLLWTFVIFIFKLADVCSYVAITNGVYSGISVGLNRNLRSQDCSAIVDSLKKMFENASGVLSNATSGLSFGSIFVVIPNTWSTCGTYSVNNAEGYMTYNDSTIRIGNVDPLFGYEPWTSQPSGCGIQGDFISMSSNWLLSSAYSDEQRGSRLVHEWAKYRWGVFEEYGHYEDPVYPESFRQSDGSWVPNYCTNSKLNGKFSSSCPSVTDCKFTVENTTTVSSSLMAVPELPSMKFFCDDTNHRYNIPTKQNMICNYSSAWAIISNHSDINQARSRNSLTKSLSITVLRENFANSLVITYETSKAMTDIIDRFEFQKESIAQFIVYEAPDSAKIGLVSFSNVPILQTSVLQPLDAQSRKNLANQVLATSADKTNNNVNLQTALQTSSSILTQGNGIILLITRCTGEVPNFTSSELALSANEHPVWIILYPTNSTLNLAVYSELAYLTGGKLLIIQEEVIHAPALGTYVSTSIRMRLSQAIRQLLHLEPAFDYRQITYESCNRSKCDTTITAPTGFQKPMFVNIYHDTGDYLDPSSSVVVSGGSCSANELGLSVSTTNIVKCTTDDQAPTFNIQITRKRSLAILIIELVGRPVVSDTGYEFQLVGSKSLYGLRYTQNSAPAIYVQLSANGTNIVYANVSATIISNVTTSTYAQIYLRDDGTEADITGNDGIYSAFLVPPLPVGDFSVSFTANNDAGKAKLLPTTYDSSRSYVCCGSVIPLPTYLTAAQDFSVSSLSILGAVIESPKNLNLPPGVIKDFHYTLGGDTSVTLSFTATGGDLSYGTADHYVLKRYQNNLEDVTEKRLTFEPKPSGSVETYVENSLACETTNIVSIYAVDNEGLKGSESNRITVYVPCLVRSGGLSVGAWIGIALACLFVIIILIGFIIYILFYEDKWKDNKKGMHAKLATCSCCDKEEHDADSTYNDVDNTVNSIVVAKDIAPPVQQIRTINDLVSSHDKEFGLSEEGRPYSVQELDDFDPRYQVGPPSFETEDTDSIQAFHMKKYDSERSLQSARTASPFMSTHSMNKIGVPFRSPASSISDYRTIPLGKSNNSLYNTQV